MRATARTKSVALVFAVSFASLAACGERSSGFTDQVDVLVDAGPESDSGACQAAFRCSRDLHSVVDACTGQVTQECPPEQGCNNGTCVDACLSAEGQQGTLGCSFWTVPSVGVRDKETQGSCYAAVIANSWSTPLDVRIDYDGASPDLAGHIFIPRTNGDKIDYEPLAGSLPPGEVAVVFLSQSDVEANPAMYIACPRPALLGTNPIPPGTGRGHAFHIVTSRPSTIYSVFPYGGARSYVPSATVLLPEGALDENYLAVDAWNRQDSNSYGGPMSVQLVATADDTKVSMQMKEAVNLPPEWNAGNGSVKTFTLAKGELLQFMEDADFIGSPIVSNHPLAVFGGQSCFNIQIGACDSAQQQIPPLKAWGSEYAAVRYHNRDDVNLGKSASDERVPWMILAAADDTVLTYDPPIFGAPEKLARGQVATFWTDKPFVVRSQDHDHPVYVAGYMTGAGQAHDMGDPEFVNVVPTEQYLDSYTFFTDITYEFTTLVLVRRNEGQGFKDVELDCAGTISGWQPLGTQGDLEYAYLDMVRNRKPQEFPGGTCGNGRHYIHSDGTFMTTVWGFGPYSSYAYPGGAGLRPITPVRVQVN